MRTYYTHDGKLDALHVRFKDHTQEILERLGMKVVAYWTPTTRPDSENTLIYILEHGSEQDANNKWKTFIADPDWIKAYKASKSNGNLVDKIDVVFIQKTDFLPSYKQCSQRLKSKAACEFCFVSHGFKSAYSSGCR